MPRVPHAPFFRWGTELGKILTTYNLRKRVVIIIDWCHMCKNQSRFFLHCVVAQELRSLVFSLFGISWEMPSPMMDFISCWKGKYGAGPHTPKNKGTDPLCLMWCNWR